MAGLAIIQCIQSKMLQLTRSLTRSRCHPFHFPKNFPRSQSVSNLWDPWRLKFKDQHLPNDKILVIGMMTVINPQLHKSVPSA